MTEKRMLTPRRGRSFRCSDGTMLNHGDMIECDHPDAGRGGNVLVSVFIPGVGDLSDVSPDADEEIELLEEEDTVEGF